MISACSVPRPEQNASPTYDTRGLHHEHPHVKTTNRLVVDTNLWPYPFLPAFRPSLPLPAVGLPRIFFPSQPGAAAPATASGAPRRPFLSADPRSDVQSAAPAGARSLAAAFPIGLSGPSVGWCSAPPPGHGTEVGRRPLME
ncbi:hypothetical protein SEVIR_4G104750v4 [Setaria viridis]